MIEIDRRRSKSTVGDRFWRYRPVAGGPRTGNMADLYVPLISGGIDQNCKPCYDVLAEVTHGEINRGGLGRVPQCRRGGSIDREERDEDARQRIVVLWAWQHLGIAEAGLPWSHRYLAVMEGERWT
ncbi:hypothetical protein B296_00024084 [Ensete ventricosum]|uniref:Uncharacterized protein n=1 Tax=Ensete ventricosum TaxID=4639 RepID=A0A427AL25_ENSVE|nr:hypothetical protein B296_00024084 [Ensete ventricosum]